MSDTKHIDAVTGTATTGHEWDGIRELNTPLPRWWLYTIYATIVWGIGYIAYYPALPLINDATKGMSGWNARTEVVEELGKLQALRGPMNDKLAKTALADVKKDPDLLSFASAAGSAAFATNCAPCHGAGGQGAKGYPNLHADRWIWGGKLADIEQTIAHGIRWDADSKTRSGAMPAFGRDKILDQDQISQVADYVLSFTNRAPKDAKLAAGKKIYDDNCAACHGDTGKGNREVGAPNLTTQVWLYGGDNADIMERVRVGGGGVMPAWSGRLEPTTIKALAVYVHGFGGGEN
jgi:cytochrome c oxidase cbb3-type subunit 3